VDLSGAPLRSSAAISRYSGANATTPTEAAAGSNSNGLNGACTGGTDNANASLSLTSSQTNSVLFVATHPRATTITTADPDYTQRAFVSNFASGDGANLYLHDRTLTNPATDIAAHTLNNAVDWDMAGVVINPASSVNPAGRYKNIIEGTGGSTAPFNAVGQNFYWYADQTWPTGSGDASIAAGTYTSNLYFNSRPAAFGVQVDSASSGQTQRTSMTISHTTSGSNRLMLVGVALNNNQSETVSSVTYNGLALTLVGTAASTTNTRVEIWRRIAPSTGTNDVVITFSGNLRYGARAGVMTFTGAHQTTPLGTFAGANGNTVGPATVNVTSAATDLVFDTVGCAANDTATLCGSLTVGAGQTQRWNLFALDAGSTGEQTRAAGSTEPGAASVTMSWAIAPVTAVPWAIGAVPIKPSGASAPVVDSVSSGDARPATLTISHTTSGLNRLMLVGISMVNDELETVTSVTYNGVALTKVGEQNSSDDGRMEIWRLIAPPTGTYNVVITFSAPLRRAAVAGVMTFTGVHQTTPLGTFASDFRQAPLITDPPTVNVTSAANELVFDTVACETCTSHTVGAGQTQRWNLIETSGYPQSLGAGSTEPGAATVTMSWTQGTADHWAIGGVSIKPAATPSVDITVRVHHTAADGSGATLITSTTTTVTSSTSDPLALNLGSVSAQTFTSADPRRLRLQIEVTGVTSSGSFVLDYDGADGGTCTSNACSNLNTPVVTVPEGAVALAAVGILIPLVTAGAWRRRRLIERARRASSPFSQGRRAAGRRRAVPGAQDHTPRIDDAHSRPRA
jgi:hypothetical protein